MCFAPQRRAIFRHRNIKKWSENVVFCTFSLEHVLLATAACNFSTSELQKVVRTWHVLYIFTWKCASRHSGVQFFNISTSKSGPKLTCFVHFHLKMCFSPQRRAIFQHLNFKKWSEADVFCTFSLENVLLATAACHFSTSQLQKVVRSWRVLYIFTWKCASRHSGVQFLISPLTTWLRTRRFNEPTFRLTRHTNHWKNTAFRDFSNIWRGCIFFLLTFAQLHLLSSDFTSSHLLFICFSTLHIVGSYYLNFLRSWFVLLGKIWIAEPVSRWCFSHRAGCLGSTLKLEIIDMYSVHFRWFKIGEYPKINCQLLIDSSRRLEARTGQTALKAAHAAGLSGGTATRWELRPWEFSLKFADKEIRWHYGWAYVATLTFQDVDFFL